MLCAQCKSKEHNKTPWIIESMKAKDKWIDELLASCDFLAKEYVKIHGDLNLPAHILNTMEYSDTLKPPKKAFPSPF